MNILKTKKLKTIYVGKNERMNKEERKYIRNQ